MSGPYKIGDIVPLPHDIDRDVALQWARLYKRSGGQARAEGKNARSFAAKAAIVQAQINEERRIDPVEHAKTYLRSKGYIPVAKMSKAEGGGYLVGRHRFEKPEELMQFAIEKGWKRTDG